LIEDDYPGCGETGVIMGACDSHGKCVGEDDEKHCNDKKIQ